MTDIEALEWVAGMIERHHRQCKWGSACDRDEWPECNTRESVADDIIADIRAEIAGLRALDEATLREGGEKLARLKPAERHGRK